MTLIDKEHLWSFLKMYQYDQTSEEKQNAVLGCVGLLEQEKEVEAIPVSFIKEQIKQMGDYEESWNYQALIEEWRKENDCL